MSTTPAPDLSVVPLTAEQLPDDPATLKGMILELLATLHEERSDRQQLQHRLDLLLRRLYGPRTEHFNPNQPLLFDDTAAAASTPAADGSPAPTEPPPGTAATPSGPRRARPHGRRPLPEDLPRRPVHHILTEAERVCVCGQLRVDIGSDVSEQLDWQPATFFVWKYFVHKYACPCCSQPAAPAAPAPAVSTDAFAPVPSDTAIRDVAVAARGPSVIAASKPAGPIDKGLPGPGLLAQIIVSKYFDHLPLYRQENIFERQGVFLPRSTTCDWMAACAALLRPLYDDMVAFVLQSAWLHTDDTPVQNLGHAADATPTARFWIYWGDRDHPCNVYDFTVNRQRDGPQTFLADYHGYLHADAFTGYDALYLPKARSGTAPIQEVACNAHARRKFYEARTSDAARSHQALAYYSQLYELERRAQDNAFDDSQRLQLRQDLAVPILEKFQAWLKEQKSLVLPKSPMAEAIGYAVNNWSALIRYTTAGFLAIDNNVAEREMKRIAIGRKNWLFVGSAKGGETAAVLFSFTSTCHRLKINPWEYLQDVLTRLPRTSADQRAELLPHRWQAARQAATTAAPQAPGATADAAS